MSSDKIFQLSEVREIIQNLENPLAEVDEVLMELNRFNLTEEQKKANFE
jgi:hypothetical protein